MNQKKALLHHRSLMTQVFYNNIHSTDPHPYPYGPPPIYVACLLSLTFKFCFKFSLSLPVQAGVGLGLFQVWKQSTGLSALLIATTISTHGPDNWVLLLSNNTILYPFWHSQSQGLVTLIKWFQSK
jgi:hypothetical protein